MGAEVVADQDQSLGIWITLIADRAKQSGKVDAGLAFSYLHMPLSSKRLKRHEQIRHPAPHVLAVLFWRICLDAQVMVGEPLQ